MATHQQHQGSPDVHSKQRHSNRGDDTPHDQGMPLPLPNAANQAPGMVAQVLDLPPVQRKATRVKQVYAQLNKRDKQKQVKRRYRMGTDL